MQPYFLPYIGAFQLINAVDVYLVYGKFKYRNDGWFHRNRILIKGYGPIYFNVSLNSASIHKSFDEINVHNSMEWREKILKTYEQNYRNTEFFSEVYDLFKRIIYCQSDNLADYNINSLRLICNYLGIDTTIKRDSSLEDEMENMLLNVDLNQFYNLGIYDTKTLRILKLCEKIHATDYYNPIGGVGLYDRRVFSQNGINLKFLQTSDITYKQSNKDFVPNLSIIDIISNCGKEKTREFLTMYSLV